MLQRSRLPAIGTDSTSVREAETFMAATDRPPEVSPPPLLIMRRPSPSRSFVLASLRAFYGLGGHLDLSDAGPDGAVPGKPVGTVWLAWAMRRGSAVRVSVQLRHFRGDRESVRRKTVRAALTGLYALIGR